jgi:aryl-alcohol dehydrogenase-like predicted oxidoreductase
LAVGVLSGKYLQGQHLVVQDSDNSRIQPDQQHYQRYIAPPENADIVHRVIEVTHTHDVTPAQIALAWLLHKGVVSPIIGTSNLDHVEEAVETLSIRLSDREITYLEEPCRAKPVTGHL